MKWMKFSGLVILFTLFMISSCENENSFQSSGVITGPDIRDCICCGGYFIEIEDSTYNFDILPDSSPIDLTTEIFPVNVKLDWERDRKCGNIQYITISRIARE